MSMGEFQSTCQKVELSEKIRELSELPLTCKERQGLLTYTESFLPLLTRVIQHSLDATIVMGGFLFLSHLMKER